MPVDRSQSVEFRVMHRAWPLFSDQTHDFSPRPEPTAERQQFPDAQVDHLVLQLAAVNRLFFVAQGILDRLCQSLARVAQIHHGDDLLFDEAFFSGVFVRAVTHYQRFNCHGFIFQFCRLIDSARPAERREELNAAKPIELSCDVQQLICVINFVHAPILARAFETGRDWDRL